MIKKLSVLILAIALLGSLAVGCTDKNKPSPNPGTSTTPGGASTVSPNATNSGELVAKGYQKDMKKDVITIRAVRPTTGDEAIFDQTAFGPQYRMWEDEINKEGGLYVKSLDRKVKVEIKIYDDASEMNQTTRLFEQMVSSEKPDLILGPEGTARLFACAPLAQKYGYLLLAAEGGALELAEQFDVIRQDYGTVNTFSILSYSETQVPALIKIFVAEGIKSVYCAYISDLHGFEYWNATEKALKEVGIEIKGSEPVDPNDIPADAIINNAKASGAQAFLSYTYPQQSIPIAQAAVRLDYNPDVYLVGPGGTYDFFGTFAFGDPTNLALEGLMGWGAWNEKSSDSAKEYSQHFRKYWTDKGYFWQKADGSPNDAGDKTVYQDWWGHICYYSVMQILQQAVENAGELNDKGMINNETLVKYIESSTFNTVMNPKLHFTNNILLDDMYLGNVGQWQNGIAEVIDADARRTAPPIIPKPPWKKG